MRTKHIPGLALAIILWGCNPSVETDINAVTGIMRSDAVLAPEEFVDWCKDEENGLVKAKQLGEITYSLQYKPAEYVLCTEHGSNSLPADQVKLELSELDGLDYYDFKIQLTDGSGELLKYKTASYQEYDARVNYMSFAMQNDLKLIAGEDTLGCKLFHFERIYDVAPYATLLLAFPKARGNERTFMYQDKLFGKGIIKFTFTKEELSNVPQLQTL